MLSKKHYVRIAEVIKEHQPSATFVIDLMAYFNEDNPRFDEDRFIEACKKEVK